jgi:hypothetical protein
MNGRCGGLWKLLCHRECCCEAVKAVGDGDCSDLEVVGTVGGDV